ncbi:MAG: alpha/beta hydrolase [Anaerolineae bacterium]
MRFRHTLSLIALMWLMTLPLSAQTTEIQTLLDQPYVNQPDARQVLDIYLPASGTPAPYPTIFMVHGGGFYTGDKEELRQVAERYADMGYAVVAPNYRLAPQVTFPDAHGDAFCALAWTFAQAEQYQLDLTRLTLLGESAGGNIVAYLGAVDDPADYLRDCDTAYPDDPQFQAVISLYMPVDLLTCECSLARRMASLYTGISYFDWLDQSAIQQYMDISVITSLDAEDPPFYLLHGDRDFLVPVSESQFFADAYRSVGGQVELVVLEGANHGFLNFPSSFRDASYELLDDWLDVRS